MKKILLSGFAGMLLLSATVTSNAQVASTKNTASGDIISNERPSTSIAAGRVNQKAVNDLAKSFKNVSGEQWYSVKDGFVAMFTLGAIDHQVSYDLKGNWLFTIRSYRESNLPEDIRRMVKSSYYDYDINLVQDVEKPATPKAYIIQLVGKTELMKLRIFDGEMQVLQHFAKSE